MRYQIVIIFMIASGTALGVFGVVLLGWLRLTSRDHQLRLDRLRGQALRLRSDGGR